MLSAGMHADRRYEMRVKILDGAMGTMLQNAGMKPGERTEIFGMQFPEILESIQLQYIESGSDIIYANTFGANAGKLSGTGYTPDEVIRANVISARNAVKASGKDVRVALDIGPIGELMEPLGTLSFDEAYDIFAEMVKAGEAAGADLVIFETMSDLSELRAGILAASEKSSLPVWATMSFERNGRTFTGTTVASFAMMMQSLPVEAAGINCSLGPEEIWPFIREMREWTDKPLIVKPNAGLPDPVTGTYMLDPELFAAQMKEFAGPDVSYMGGCCGTTPEHIRKLAEMAGHASGGDGCGTESRAGIRRGLCTSGRVAEYGRLLVIGERINPTGKKRLQQALIDRDLGYIMKCAIEQQQAGADILDINVGLPEINEPEMMAAAVKAVQSVSDLPLQIDSTKAEAVEAGLRACTGKAIVNSVNGDEEKLDTVLPLVKKYGAAVIGLTMDRNGIPETAEERFRIAERILSYTRKYGIPDEDVIIDCLALTISSLQEQAVQTLEAIKMVHDRLHLHCTLGVSNISFGLPERNHITAAFLAQAAACGMDMPIVNPNTAEIMDMVASCRALFAEDKGCEAYIERFASEAPADKPSKPAEMTLEDAVLKGLGSEVERIVSQLLDSMSEMDVIDTKLIPALDEVGTRYEKEQLFLPQLISAANAAGCGFEIIKKKMLRGGKASADKGRIVLATVEGDIHDIGKNIVKVVLENYGYRIIDLGKDVPPEKVVEAAIRENVKLIGLSALMTTTVESMKRTIEQLRQSGHECSVMVGGAVLTPEYAERIGADYYAKDAKASADIAKQVLG